MSENVIIRYWCHMCSQVVSPVNEVEIKCPRCNNGFIEEVEQVQRARSPPAAAGELAAGIASDRMLSMWTPVLFGMLGGPNRRRRNVSMEENEGENTDADHEFDSLIRRGLRSAAILQMLHGMEGNRESDNSNTEGERGEGERERQREREHFILFNPFSNAIIVQRSFNIGEGEERSNPASGISFGDYFLGPQLDALLQHLADNDPNRYGTPPAQKAAVDALPIVKINEDMSCPVCLEELEIGSEAKQMPCNHKFHTDCLLPWLEMHSSCPVCRYQLPTEGSKDSNANSNSYRAESDNGDESNSDHGRSGRRFRLWPFTRLFSSSRSPTGGNSAPNSAPSENIS